jgi:hypothetical protein
VRLSALVPLALSIVCCDGPAPARVQVDMPEQVLSSAPVRALVWQFDEKNARSEAKHPDVSIEPQDLATVDSAGNITCKKTGDGKVTAAVSGVKSSAPLACRLVDHLEAPDDLGRIELTKGPVKLDVGAYTKDGQRLDDVVLNITTRNSKIAKPDGDKLVPLTVGEAKVRVRAGDAEREFSVQIVEKVEPEPIPIDKDRKLDFTLEPGRYELTIELEQEKKLTAEWRRAPYCNYSATAKVHTMQCLLEVKGGVTFDNPAYLNRGETTVSRDGITLLLIGE